MLDIKTLRNEAVDVANKLARRGAIFNVDAFRELDSKRKAAMIKSQNLQAERKRVSGEIGRLVKNGLSVDDAKEKVAEKLENINLELEVTNKEASSIQSQMKNFILELPNIPDDLVPEGDSEDDNREICTWGVTKDFDFEPQDHVSLGENLGYLDTEIASLITGSRFSVLYGDLSRLHRALIHYMLDRHTLEFGYQEVYVPYLVNRDSLFGTGNLPKFEDDLFKLEGEQNYYLIPTAEVPVTNLARDRIFSASEMGDKGMKFVCHTPCFRSEAGSYGRDTRGMIRQHQFEKVELVQMVPPFLGEEALENLTSHAEAILEGLELPYRKVLLCAGDMGFSSRKTYDLEVWLPGQNAYREISSCSHFGDFQARRMSARWRNPENGEVELIHTLNGSALAVGRALVAILENYQTKDGSITIPNVLKPYMNGLKQLA